MKGLSTSPIDVYQRAIENALSTNAITKTGIRPVTYVYQWAARSIEQEMKTIDAHTHAWGPNTSALPWQAEVLPPGWSGAYTHEDLIRDMDRAGVEEAVIVTTPLYGRGPGANEYTRRAIDAHPDRLFGVGLLELFHDDPADARAALERVTDHPRMLGIRMHAALAYGAIPGPVDRDADWILDERLDPIWKRAGALDTCVFVFPKAQQLSDVGTLAKRYPETTIVIDHMAWPDETTSPTEPTWTDFETLALENVYVKVSSIPRSSTQSWPYEDIHEYVRALLEWFGPERLLLGSDYPWMDDWAEYEDCLSWIDHVDGLSRRDREFLRHRTFERLHK